MKKLFVSVGLVAAGATSVQSVMGDGLDLVSPNSWSVSGNLRGFYDDNYNIAPGKKGSFGAEISPTVSYNLPLRQTDFGIRYTYGLYYYQDREDLGLNPFDQTHQVDLWYDHAINEKWHINASDTFASGQEPELIAGSSLVNPGVLYRVNGDNIGNHAKISLDTQWTPLFGTSLHYGNDWYDFANSGASTTLAPILTTVPTLGSVISGSQQNAAYQFKNSNGASLAGLLNRVDQNIGLDANWTLSPTTKILAGYSFDLDTYTGHEPIATFNYGVPAGIGATNYYGKVYSSATRDTAAQQFYIGGQYNITPNLSLLGTLGVEYNDSYNNPTGNSTTLAPMADVSLTYTYTAGSYVQLGVQQGENSTYIAQPSNNGDITQYQYSTTVYGDINQKLFNKLMATLIGRYVYSTYEGGLYGDDEDNYVSLGVNLSYQISRHFSAEVGYNYDDLQSSIPGNGYDRNRVYIGLGANY